jgi:hypothetical protein
MKENNKENNEELENQDEQGAAESGAKNPPQDGQDAQDADDSQQGAKDGSDEKDKKDAAPADKDKNKPADDKNKEDKDDKQNAVAPEAYKDFTLPEGYEIDKDLAVEFAALAKEDNLSQEKAQKYIDLQIKAQRKINEGFKAITDNWQAETIKMLGADKDGKLTPEGQKKLALIKQTALKAGGQEAVDILDATCAGKHKAVANLLLAVAPYVLEDDINIDGKTPTPTKSDGELFYGKSKK